jgi:hypothetical protein
MPFLNLARRALPKRYSVGRRQLGNEIEFKLDAKSNRDLFARGNGRIRSRPLQLRYLLLGDANAGCQVRLGEPRILPGPTERHGNGKLGVDIDRFATRSRRGLRRRPAVDEVSLEPALECLLGSNTGVGLGGTKCGAARRVNEDRAPVAGRPG